MFYHIYGDSNSLVHHASHLHFYWSDEGIGFNVLIARKGAQFRNTTISSEFKILDSELRNSDYPHFLGKSQY